MRLNDVLSAVTTVTLVDGMQYLTAAMKDVLTASLIELERELAHDAYEYFTVHDFEDTPEIREVMYKVVKLHLLGGA